MVAVADLTLAEKPDPMTCSPDGESRGLIARAGDVFPLDPHPTLLAQAPAGPSEDGSRPWGLRFLRTPRARASVARTLERAVYDPVRQVSINRFTGEPMLRHAGGTKETTGDSDGQRPSPEETTKD
jgi:putative ATP-grasp target RiPP